MSAYRRATLVLLLLTVGIGVVIFAPTSVGGRVTYAATSGRSMEPEFKSGDLVLLRKAGSVGVGDVAAYRSPDSGEVVIHRVVAVADGRLRFKGDNNWWVDSYEPTRDEVIGTLWVHANGLGAKVNSMHPGVVLGSAGAVMGAVVTGSRLPSRASRRRTARRAGFADERWQVLGLLLLAIAGCSGALALAAFRSSATEPVERNWHGQHNGAFAYEGQAVSSPVYEGDIVRTGQPIFVNLAPRLTASFTYQLDAPGAQDVRGTIRLLTVTRDINGWERSADVVTETAFSGTQASVSTELELAPLMAAAAEVQRATGSASRYLTTAVTAEVQVSGIVDGQPFHSAFSPFFTLRVTPPNEIFVETALTRDFENAPPGATSNLGNAFTPIQQLTLPFTETADATMDLLFDEVRVSRVRWAAAAVALASLGAATGVLAVSALSARTPAARLRARYGDRLVRVTRLRPELDGALRVETMDDLVGIADRHQALILWDAAEGRDVFAVRHDGALFTYEQEGLP